MLTLDTALRHLSISPGVGLCLQRGFPKCRVRTMGEKAQQLVQTLKKLEAEKISLVNKINDLELERKEYKYGWAFPRDIPAFHVVGWF